MSDLPSPPSLTDRVLARVNDASQSADRREKAARPRLSRRSGAGDATPEQLRQARSLRRVFRELGASYRAYRRRTGEPVSSEVRDAAVRFRREVSVPSLVSVAACLDRLEILTW